MTEFFSPLISRKRENNTFKQRDNEFCSNDGSLQRLLKTALLFECYVCICHYPRHFPYIITYNNHQLIINITILLFSFYKRGNCYLVKIRNISRASQLVIGGADFKFNSVKLKPVFSPLCYGNCQHNGSSTRETIQGVSYLYSTELDGI